MPTLNTSGVALADTALLHLAMEEGTRSFSVCFHSTTEEDNIAHQQQ